MKLVKLVCACCCILMFSFFTVSADEKEYGIEKAEGARLSIAIGHYTRARQLLLSAVREFDKGVKLANPEILIDIEKWRANINGRAQDLEVIISPQPRVSNEGVTNTGDIKIFDNKR